MYTQKHACGPSRHPDEEMERMIFLHSGYRRSEEVGVLDGPFEVQEDYLCAICPMN